MHYAIILIIFFCHSLHGEDAKPTPLATVEQLQSKVAEQSKEIEALRSYIAASEQYSAKDKASIAAAYQSCMGNPPILPEKPTKPEEPKK